jgi:hypothetical protein
VKKTVVIAGAIIFILVWGLLLPSRLTVPVDFTFSSDAMQYSNTAIHLVQLGMYSLDGHTPSFEREPGYSFFLAFLYKFFGIENRVVLFAVQGLLYLFAVIIFCRTLQKSQKEYVASLCYIFLLTLPAVFHTIFSGYRESLTLSLLLLFAAGFLHMQRECSYKNAVFLGLLLGCIILVYMPFLFLPFFLIPLGLIFTIPRKHLTILVITPCLVVSLWGVRSALYDGEFRLTGNFRTTAIWYARAEQAEHVHGFEAFRCLYAEYIARDWSGRSSACSTNYLINTRWPGRFPTGEEHLIARESQKKILLHFPSYLWFSLFEVLELHIPYVNGWGFLYNVLASLSALVLYVGCILSLPSLLRKENALFLVLTMYSVSVFSLTDATPRYLIPTIFCYAVFASIGYTDLFQKILRS